MDDKIKKIIELATEYQELDDKEPYGAYASKRDLVDEILKIAQEDLLE